MNQFISNFKILLCSLIKMLYWLCEKSGGRQLTWPQMRHAIMRNFGGFISTQVDPFEVFRTKLGMLEKNPNPEDFPSEVYTVLPYYYVYVWSNALSQCRLV